MIERTVLLPAGPDEVWRAITESDHLSKWFGCPVELDPRPGGRVTIHEQGRTRRGLVEEVRPGRLLSFRWLPHLGSAEHRTRVEFVLEPRSDGTLLTVTESPLELGAQMLVGAT